MPFIRRKTCEEIKVKLHAVYKAESGSRQRKEVIAKTEAYFEEFDKSYFLDCIKMLKYCWAKCIELKGDSPCKYSPCTYPTQDNSFHFFLICDIPAYVSIKHNSTK